jgi:hypothetical protein
VGGSGLCQEGEGGVHREPAGIRGAPATPLPAPEQPSRFTTLPNPMGHQPPRGPRSPGTGPGWPLVPYFGSLSEGESRHLSVQSPPEQGR